MQPSLTKELYSAGIISPQSAEKLRRNHDPATLSIHWEIRGILYLGILLLTGGLGVLVYKNLDSLGHQVIVAFISLVCAGSFLYCTRHRKPFSTARVDSPNAFFDYVLLLACSLFITLVVYLQVQYKVFGQRYGLEAFLPMLVLFFSAYSFDHIGVLSMAIVNLGAWLGLAVTPMDILSNNDFNSSTIIFTGMALGALLVGMAAVSERKSIKAHFAFTYANFGTHLLMICCLAAMFHFGPPYLLWLLVLFAFVYLFYRMALAKRSFYFILVITCYAYTGISACVLYFMSLAGSEMGTIYLAFFYFIISAVALIVFLMRTNKQLKAHDRI